VAECILFSVILLAWLIFGGAGFLRASALGLRKIRGPASRKQTERVHTDDRPQDRQVDNTLACRVQLDPGSSDNNAPAGFVVMIRGPIEVPEPMYQTDVQVLIADITDGVDSPQPVLCAARQWQLDDSPAFCYRACNGRIPSTDFVISDWLTVVRVPVDLLRFAARGDRVLQFVTSLLSHETGNVLATANFAMEYRNDNSPKSRDTDHSSGDGGLSGRRSVAASGYSAPCAMD